MSTIQASPVIPFTLTLTLLRRVLASWMREPFLRACSSSCCTLGEGKSHVSQYSSPLPHLPWVTGSTEVGALAWALHEMQ